jgi:2-isopropylmalate synthase
LKGDSVRDAAYSGVPASMVGRQQQIEIGPMSGKANVRQYLEQRRIDPSARLLAAILRRAKASNSVLPEHEVLAIVSANDRRAPVRRRAG